MPRFDDDPAGIPLEHVGRLGQTWFIDTNIIGDGSEAVAALLGLRAEGWARLVKSDMLDTERAKDEDPERSTRLAEESAGFDEMLGPWVWDHSRWDHSVWASEDEARIEQVFSVTFPNKARDAASANDVRDALHIATAIRYGAQGFVTRDRGLLRSTAAVREAYNGFYIMTPEQAVTIAERLRARSLEARRRREAGA